LQQLKELCRKKAQKAHKKHMLLGFETLRILRIFAAKNLFSFGSGFAD